MLEVLREQGASLYGVYHDTQLMSTYTGERLRTIEEENRRLYENLQYCFDEISRIAPGRSVRLPAINPSIRIFLMLTMLRRRTKIGHSVSNRHSNGRTTKSPFAHPYDKTPSLIQNRRIHHLRRWSMKQRGHLLSRKITNTIMTGLHRRDRHPA